MLVMMAAAPVNTRPKATYRPPGLRILCGTVTFIEKIPEGMSMTPYPYRPRIEQTGQSLDTKDSKRNGCQKKDLHVNSAFRQFQLRTKVRHICRLRLSKHAFIVCQ